MSNPTSQPLLSICIPTYNRAKMLRVCLDSILNQFVDLGLSGLVEVVVSDNASGDGTRELVLEYQKKFPQLKYFRNAENLGADKNIANSVIKATGKFGWYFGDDDALAPGAIKYVVGILQKFQPAVVNLKSADLEAPDKAPGPQFQITEKDPIVISDFREFVEKGYCPGTLSVLLFDRDLWLSTDKTNTHPLWECIEIIIRLISEAKGRKFVYIDQVCVYTGAGGGWVKNGTELDTFLNWKEIVSSLGQYGYDENWIRQEQADFPKALILILLRAKGHDLPMDFKYLKRIYSNFSGHNFYLALATLIFYVPNFIIKAVRDTKKSF